MQIHSKFISED